MHFCHGIGVVLIIAAARGVILQDDHFVPPRYDILPYNFVFWMHIQKTSSWLGDTIAVWACPHILGAFDQAAEDKVSVYSTEDFRTTVDLCKVKLFDSYDVRWGRYGYHVPYIPRQFPRMKHSTVSVFRQPVDRLISAFLFRTGIMIPRGSVYHTKYYNETILGAAAAFKRKIRSAPYPIVAYANHSEIPSCQAKMVLGYHCGSDIAVTAPMIAEAKRRLREEFLFIGLTEEPHATLHLFHTIFGGMNVGINSQIRRNTQHTVEKHDQLVEVLQQHNWSDGADEEVYHEAARIFYTQCKKYGIATVYGNRYE